MSSVQMEEKKGQAGRPFPFVFIGVVGLLAAAGWAWIYRAAGSMAPGPHATMLMELSKVLAQVVLITVLGATVTFLYNQYAKDREQRRLRIDEDNRLRHELLDSVIAVRAQVERARRRFRLLPKSEKKAGYRAALEEVLEARLRLSQVWHDSHTYQNLYPGRDAEIDKGLQGMKVYLDQLIDEYEDCSPAIQEAGDETALAAIQKLPYFGSFFVDQGGDLYARDFLGRHYRTVTQIIRSSILDSAQQAQAPENDGTSS